MFYFEELYKKEKISTTDFLNYVSKFDSETSEQIGDLRFAQSKNKKYLETLKILELKKIPYLTELINYKPEYPY